MKNKLKRIFILVLFVVLFFQTGGLLFIFQLQQQAVQYKMDKVLEKSTASCQKLVLTFSDYKNCRINAHEIIFKGNLYDVVSIRVAKNKVVMLAINDRDEERILEQIKLFVSGTNKTGTPLPNPLQNLLSLIYIPVDAGYFHIMQCSAALAFFDHVMDLQPDNSEIQSPPPEII